MRRQIRGASAIEQALVRGEPVRMVLVLSEGASPDALRVAELASQAGAEVHPSAPAELWRLSAGEPAAEILALVGPDPRLPLEEALARPGPAWLLCGLQYPGNTGFAIRTAEVSGAAAIVIDNDFGPRERRRALRASMGADRFFPVAWEPAERVIEASRAAGRRVVAVEDVGSRTPWEVDLTGPLLMVVGGEHAGVPEGVLAAADDIIRVPMRGFVPSHNLQAAMAVVLGERMRQDEGSS
jgi:RNA methyltransferase, TrmH family